jgi:long-chain acyl-CoA synthetase
MEATAAASSTGLQTIAELVPRAAAEYADHVAVRYKRDDSWQDLSYAELAQIVQEIGLGLIDLGIEAGERVSILANTRPEWSYADLAATSAGTIVVPIYQTNSPEECHWVLSDSEACAVVCENEEQLAKIAAIRDRLPSLRTVIVMDPPSGAEANGSGSAAASLQAISLDEVRERGRKRSAEELQSRRAAVRPRTPSRSSTPPAPPGRRRAAS